MRGAVIGAGQKRARYRAGAAALLLTTALGLAMAPAAWAQTPAQAAQSRTFQIPAGPLADALVQFGYQSGLQVAADGALTVSARSPGISGSFAPLEALSQLLAGTGLTFRVTSAGSVQLERAPQTSSSAIQLGPVQVQGASGASDTQKPAGPGVGFVASRSVAGTKTDTPILETPQTLSVISRSQLDVLAPLYITQAARYEPGTQTDYDGVDPRSGGGIGLRGFSADNYLDGLRVASGEFVGPEYDPYLMERIEIVQGPSAALYGQSQPGGIINLVSKRPTDASIHEVMLQTGSYDRFGGGFDFGGRIDDDGHWLYRVTGVGSDSGTQVDKTKLSQFSVAPAITWRPDDATSLTVLVNFRYDPNDGFWNKLPALGTLVRNPDGQIPDNMFTGDLGFNKYRLEQAAIGYLFEHKFDDIWTVRQNFRYQYGGGFFNSVQGDELDGTQLIRDKFQSINYSNTVALDNQAEVNFATGALTHKLLLGIDYQHAFVGEKDTDAGDGSGNEDMPALDIAAPDYYLPVPAYSPGDTYLYTRQTTDQVGGYVQDQLALGGWRALVGVRQDWAQSSTTNLLDAGAQQKQTDHATTWRAGLLYAFDNGIAPYVSYSTSFLPTIGVNADSRPFKPTTGRQYEVGLKYQPTFLNLLFTASVFDLTENNVLTADPSNPFNSIQTGAERSRGAEVQAKGDLTDNIDIIASYTYLDAKITKSNYGNAGFRIWDEPENAASLWTDYKFLEGGLAGFALGGGVRYTGDTVDQSNTLHVPDFTLFDAAVRYNFGVKYPTLKGVTLAVNVTNLFDKQYIQQCVNGCYYGYRRSVLATLKYDW